MLQEMVDALERDELVCFPTETLYALACNPFSESAIRKLYDLKRRRYSKQCSLLFSSLEEIYKFSELQSEDLRILSMLSPGPVTFILSLRSTKDLPKCFFKDTLGVRISNHKVVHDILNAFGRPLLATSANLSGLSGATKAADVPKEIGESVAVFLEDDSRVTGVCSTIFDMRSRTILRQGAVLDEKIYDVVNFITE